MYYAAGTCPPKVCPARGNQRPPPNRMTLPISTVSVIVAGVIAYLFLVGTIDRQTTGARRVTFRYIALGVTLAAYFIGLGGIHLGRLHWGGLVGSGMMPHDRAVDISKALLAIAAAGGVFYEQHRAAQRRPVAERWKRFVAITLGIASIIAYFHGFRFGYPRFYHRHDQYHYYLGAKYFQELGYDGLYKCTVLAQDELGEVRYDNETRIGEGRHKLDMRKEVHHPDRKIRNLGGDNLLIPATEALEHPELCRNNFKPERWEAFKKDIAFFRIGSDKAYWEGMQKDHGYNPPPVWTIAGTFFANMYPAGRGFLLPVVGQVNWLQCLAMLDIVYFTAMFVAVWWAFGWRVFAVAAVFWGCQASAPFYWTGGAFLRQDWLFWIVFAACLTRRRWYFLAGAAMVYAGMLRIFPGLTVIGWLAITGFQLYRHKTLSVPQWKMLGGGVLAAALLIPLSIKVAGKGSYREFYRHTLQVHDRTPLTNHMGLRVIVSQKLPFEIPAADEKSSKVRNLVLRGGFNTGVASGRMKYTKDDKLTDPFEVWKNMRNERYHKLRFVAYALVGASLLYFLWVVRRVRSMWIAQCLAQVFIILMSQLTSYYYAFMILLAPLTKARPQLEVPMFGFAALSQFVYIIFYYNDDKYWALTFISLLFCYGVLWAFLSQADRDRVVAYFQRLRPATAGGKSPTAKP